MDITLDQIDKKKLAVVVNRAKEMLQKADQANKAQYAHGINSNSSALRYYLKELEEKSPQNWTEVLQVINTLQAHTLRIGGYLFCLQEML